MEKLLGSISKRLSTSHEVTYLVLLSKISYYMCASPFVIAKDEDSVYTVQTNKKQQVVTAIVNGIATAYSIAELTILFNPKEVGMNPAYLFQQLRYLTTNIFPIVFFYVLWRNTSPLSRFLSTSQKDGAKCDSDISPLTAILIVILLIHSFNYRIYQAIKEDITWESWIQNSTLCDYVACELEYSNVSFAMKFFTSIYNLMGYYMVLIRFFFFMTTLLCAIVVYDIAKKFSRLLSRTYDVAQVYEHYCHAVDKIKDINGFVKPLLAIFIAWSFCDNIHQVFEVVIIGKGYDNIGRLHFLFTVTQDFLFYFVCAEGNRKMNYLKHWLTHYKMNEINDMEKHSGPQDAKISKMIENLEWNATTKSIGLGVGSSFLVNYDFLIVLFGVFGTYSVVQLDFYKK